jgi:hypothetical protein
MSCSGSHLGITINIKNTKFVKNLPMIDAQFRFKLDPMGKMFQNASSLKPLGQLKPNCPGMVIGRSSVFYADRKSKMAATTGHSINTEPYRGKYRNIFFSEIKKTNWSYVKNMSCSGSHLGITIKIKNTKCVKDLPMIDAQLLRFFVPI